MKVMIKLIGLALLVCGGAVGYVNRASLSTEGADTSTFMGGVVVAVIGLALLLGWEVVKGLARGIGKSF